MNQLPPLPQEVCSPMHRCFPPKPTICLFCRQTSAAECPFKFKDTEEKK